VQGLHQRGALLHLHPRGEDFYEVAKFDKRTKLEELMQDPERNPKERTLIFVQVGAEVPEFLGEGGAGGYAGGDDDEDWG